MLDTCMISKCIVSIPFLNEPDLFLFHAVKRFQELPHNSYDLKSVIYLTI